MQFSVSPRAMLMAASSFALAAAQNAFTMTTIPSVVHVGSPFNLTWQATTPGSVSIWLVQGPASNTKYVETIAANITNEGAFVWVPTSETPSGSQYALEIVSDSNPYITNWSGQFSIDGGSVDSSTSSNSTSSDSTTASTDSSAASTSAASSKPTTLNTATKTSSGASSTTESSSATSSAASVPNSNPNAAARSGVQATLSIVVLGAAMFVLL